MSPDDEVAYKSFRNLPEAHTLLASELNAYDVLCSDWVVFSQETLPGTLEKPAATPVAVGGTGETTAEATGDEV
jgi:large subunit ribosomal protein L4